MALRESTAKAQSSFADYCRTGETSGIEGAREDRISQYRRLVFSVVQNALNTAYPIVQKKYMSKDDWESLQHRFFSNHPCSDPQIWRMPSELIQYAEQHESDLCSKYPALLDLLRFEWQETYLFMMPDIEIPSHSNDCPSLSDKVVLEPEMQLLPLKYPVHNTHPSKLNETQAGQYISMAWRDREKRHVHFMGISVFFTLVLESINTSDITLLEAGKKVALQFGITTDHWKEELEKFVAKLHQKHLIFKA